MNRTDEFARIVSIFAPIDEEGILQSQVNSRTSNYLASYQADRSTPRVTKRVLLQNFSTSKAGTKFSRAVTR